MLVQSVQSNKRARLVSNTGTLYTTAISVNHFQHIAFSGVSHS